MYINISNYLQECLNRYSPNNLYSRYSTRSVSYSFSLIDIKYTRIPIYIPICCVLREYTGTFGDQKWCDERRRGLERERETQKNNRRGSILFRCLHLPYTYIVHIFVQN
jgi:hypothetical protein